MARQAPTSFRLDDDSLNQLVAAGKRLGVDRSDTVRMALRLLAYTLEAVTPAEIRDLLVRKKVKRG
jgi:antitoxin component of RelBE/YafQ-DinJ toxin-antitoxin module